MERYFKRNSLSSIEENSRVKKINVEVDDNHDIQENDYTHKASIEENSEAKKASVEEEIHIEENEQVNKGSIEQIDSAQLPTDLGLRTPIMDCNINLRDQIRRVYLQSGPCQPRNHAFPRKKLRRFLTTWFNKFSD